MDSFGCSYHFDGAGDGMRGVYSHCYHARRYGDHVDTDWHACDETAASCHAHLNSDTIGRHGGGIHPNSYAHLNSDTIGRHGGGIHPNSHAHLNSDTIGRHGAGIHPNSHAHLNSDTPDRHGTHVNLHDHPCPNVDFDAHSHATSYRHTHWDAYSCFVRTTRPCHLLGGHPHVRSDHRGRRQLLGG